MNPRSSCIHYDATIDRRNSRTIRLGNQQSREERGGCNLNKFSPGAFKKIKI
jgi:hypothetical protein